MNTETMEHGAIRDLCELRADLETHPVKSVLPALLIWSDSRNGQKYIAGSDRA